MCSGKNSAPLKLGVTELVRFAARQGDLFSDDTFGPDAQEGLRGHQHIQNSRKAPWQAEQALSHLWKVQQQPVRLGGRVDLLNRETSPVIVEEIKTCFGAGHLLPAERKTLHWAQLQVYAALYAQETEALTSNAAICMRLTYFDLQSRQIYQEEEIVYAREAVSYCEGLLGIYLDWWHLVTTQKQQAREFCAALAFPFEQYRPGQRETAVEVYRKLRDGAPLLIEAPTGTGKTLSVLFPTLKAFGEQQVQQILYLTAKGSTQINATQCVRQMDNNEQIDYIVLQARDKSCPCLSANTTQRNSCRTSQGMCARTLGFYDRLPQARETALKIKHLPPETVQQIAEQFQICPFAFAIHLVPWITLVIADMNYFFDPLVRLACFEEHVDGRALLIDEAHNLPGRARDMYSGQLDSALCQSVYQALPKPFAMIKKPLGKLLSLLNLIDSTQLQETQLPQRLQFALQALLAGLQQTGDNGFAGGLLEDVPQEYRQWVKEIYRFATILHIRSTAHVFMLQEGAEGSSLQLRCLDASDYLGKLYEKSKASIAFSATLQPFAFNVQQLGLPGNTQCLRLPRWFPAENQLTVCCRFVDTQWQERENTLALLVELIHCFYSAKPGHYLVFFPSYAYLDMALQLFQQRYPEVSVMRQEPEANDSERTAFVEKFMGQQGALLGFAIVGGVYAEGVDYANEALIGAMIIGTGMPQPDAEQQLVANHYRNQGLDAFQYAYQFPGLIRLLQTAGRVIRSERDRGVVLFVEPRLARQNYRALLSGQWPLTYSDSLQQTRQLLEAFWSA